MKNITWMDLLSVHYKSLLAAYCTEEDVDNLIAKMWWSSAISSEVRIIRGRRCSSKASTLQECAAALQFPYYFGDNWDALFECLSDMEWLRAKSCVLFITDADRILVEDENGFSTFLDILAAVVKEYPLQDEEDSAGHLSLFNIVLQCDEQKKEVLEDRLALSGRPFMNVQLSGV